MDETSPTTDARAFAQANDEITRQQRRSRPQPQEKQSQIGGSPFAAVGGNTPTVQATPPSNAPSVPNASATVTKVGQVMYAAWADEFEQLLKTAKIHWIAGPREGEGPWYKTRFPGVLPFAALGGGVSQGVAAELGGGTKARIIAGLLGATTLGGLTHAVHRKKERQIAERLSQSQG